MTDFTETLFGSGDVSINVAEWPDNGPPLLFIHGITGDWSTWQEIVPAFQNDWHCYAVDLRGHGKSGHVAGGYHRDRYALDPIALIRNEIKEPTYVVGHSLGATTALGVAAGIPNLVKAVVYEDPPMFRHEAVQGRSETASDRFGWQLDLIQSGSGLEEIASAISKRSGADTAAATLKARQLMSMDADVLQASISGKATENWDAETTLKRATPPALLLYGNEELGGVMSEADTRRAIELLPEGQSEQWDDSGHGMHTAFPERFISTVNSFLRSV